MSTKIGRFFSKFVAFSGYMNFNNMQWKYCKILFIIFLGGTNSLLINTCHEHNHNDETFCSKPVQKKILSKWQKKFKQHRRNGARRGFASTKWNSRGFKLKSRNIPAQIIYSLLLQTKPSWKYKQVCFDIKFKYTVQSRFSWHIWSFKKCH